MKRWAEDWLREIAELFVLEDARYKLWQEGSGSGSRWQRAQQQLEEHVQKLKERWEAELQLSNLRKAQKTALLSFKKHWDGLTLFVIDPRIPLHNNRAERLLRSAVILRKSSFGSGTPWAGQMAAKVLSLFQTWLINGLNPEALLLDYFRECSKTPGKAPLDVTAFLPWTMSAERRTEFALPPGFEKPG